MSVAAAAGGTSARRRGAVDPVCGMTVDRERAVVRDIDGERVYFCSDHRAAAFERSAA